MSRALVVSLVGLLLVVSFKFFWKSKIALERTEGVTKVVIDGKTIPFDNISSPIQVSPGEHKIDVYGPLIKKTTHTLELSPMSKLSITAFEYTYTKEDLSRELLSQDSKRKNNLVGRSELFENNTWLTFTDYSPDGKTDSSQNIYYFNGSNWIKKISGTGFSYYNLRDQELPASVIKYFEELNRER